MSEQDANILNEQQYKIQIDSKEDQEWQAERLDSSVKFSEFRDCSDFVICITRAWHRIGQKNQLGLRDKEFHDCLNIWTQKFCTLGGAEAANHWDQFLSHLVRNMKNPLILGCKFCGKISSGEKALLNLVYLIQSRNIQEARSQLTDWTKNSDVNHALHHLVMFASILIDNKAFIDGEVIAALYEQNYTSRRLMH